MASSSPPKDVATSSSPKDVATSSPPKDVASSSPPKDVAASSPPKNTHFVDVHAATPIAAVQLKSPSQGPTRHTSHAATRRRQEPLVEDRPVDRRQSRAAYLGQWRKACRAVFEVIAEPFNSAAVEDLRGNVVRRWRLYVAAHQVHLAETDLSDRKASKLQEQHTQHAQENDDAVRTLDAYLRREEKALSRIEAPTPRREQQPRRSPAVFLEPSTPRQQPQERRSPIPAERLQVRAEEIDRLRQSVREMEAKLEQTKRNLAAPRDQSTPFDLFGTKLRQAHLQERMMNSLPPPPVRTSESVQAASRRSPTDSLPPRNDRTPLRPLDLDISATQAKVRVTPSQLPRQQVPDGDGSRPRRQLEAFVDRLLPQPAAFDDAEANRYDRTPRSQVRSRDEFTPRSENRRHQEYTPRSSPSSSSTSSLGYSLSVASTPARLDQENSSQARPSQLNSSQVHSSQVHSSQVHSS